jgi:hypothetical protein
MTMSESGMIDNAAAAYYRPDRQTRDGGPYDLRSVMIRPPGQRAWFAAADSGIKTFADIKKKKGVRIARFTNTPHYYTALLKMLQLDEKKDVVMVDYASQKACVDAVIEGNAQVSYTTPVGSLASQLEASPRGTVWLNFPTVKEDPEAIERFMEDFPHTGWDTIKLGVKGALGVNTMTLVAAMWGRADMDNDMAYNLLKWQVDNYDLFKDKTTEGKLINIDTFKLNISVAILPVHDGAIRFAKEKGLWTAAHDARQKYNLWLLDQYKKAYKATIDEADKKGIKVDPENKEWLALWERLGTQVYKLETFRALTDDKIQEKLTKYNIK